MNFTIFELIWLFFIYSFIGWVFETVMSSLKYHRFINRGFSNGPFCFIYGVSAILMTTTLWELEERWFFLFLGCTIQATFVEWLIGTILERMNHHKWWDYSHKKFNYEGYICLQYSLLWGLLGYIVMKFGNPFFLNFLNIIPEFIKTTIIWILLVVACIDFITSIAVVFRIQKETKMMHLWNDRLSKWTYHFGEWIVSHVSQRMIKAYPVIEETVTIPKKRECFASGCGFYKLFWLFFIGCILGDVVETIFCRITMGWWMSRSSLVWGPFSIVWGLAIAIATALLYKNENKSDSHLFIFGTLIGGAYEYICSVFTEIFFGKIFWDYSDMPFNLGGRVNLLFCFFWGIAAVVWIKVIYPRLSAWIEKIPMKIGTIMTWILVVFMVINMVVSSMALIRSDARAKGDVADSQWEQIIDQHFDDERMNKIYPKAIQK